MKQAEVRRALEDICEGTGVKVGHVEQLIPVETVDSGHIPYIRVVHSLGSFEVDTRRFRTELKLRSIVFQVQSEGENFIFDGKGWGHGIGMCQMGARGYARRNANRTWILQHYYPEVQIKRLW